MSHSILVDTSVWVDHFKRNNLILGDLLDADSVLSHPLIIGELACGTPPEPRSKTLSDLQTLAQTRVATSGEILAYIESHQLYGKGCGIVDISLLAATAITPNTKLWTLDKRLDALARKLGLSFDSGS